MRDDDQNQGGSASSGDSGDSGDSSSGNNTTIDFGHHTAGIDPSKLETREGQDGQENK